MLFALFAPATNNSHLGIDRNESNAAEFPVIQSQITLPEKNTQNGDLTKNQRMSLLLSASHIDVLFDFLHPLKAHSFSPLDPRAV